MLVVDLDLSSRAAIETARKALSPWRLSGTPCLFLLKDMSPRCQTQANALGATAILPADVLRATLLEKLDALLGPAGGAPAVRQRFVAASAALGDLLDAAASGGHLPVSAIDGSVDALNQAAEGGDLDAWLDLVWRHDDATYQHCLLVSGLVAAFAHRLGFGEADRRMITGAAVLHDIGKAQIPLAILRKQDVLTPEERSIVRHHPRIGHEMLVRQGGFAPIVLDAVLSHHEYLDGSGYPDGLQADRIPDAVRMITICDIYAALIERRSYKPPMAPEEAFAVLVGMGGKLDLDLVRVFGEVVVAASAARLGRQGHAAELPGRRAGAAA
ncbi:HD domain-containing protein [Hyphomicrobiales bacterium]|nr:HD domain-containing protein [Hyphomicrobiales bacterium]CAH1701208.1 HD domain-containing protein [Hyphomicrobiales bacterium]CAI0345172.1 HD domain-containing protein [Hyphomicrobiales bacterium]